MSGDGGTLESLYGINQLLLDKLEGVEYNRFQILRPRLSQRF